MAHLYDLLATVGKGDCSLDTGELRPLPVYPAGERVSYPKGNDHPSRPLPVYPVGESVSHPNASPQNYRSLALALLVPLIGFTEKGQRCSNTASDPSPLRERPPTKSLRLFLRSSRVRSFELLFSDAKPFGSDPASGSLFFVRCLSPIQKSDRPILCRNASRR